MLEYKIKNELKVLINLTLEGQATEEQYIRLNEILRSNSEALEYYVEFVEILHVLNTCDWGIEDSYLNSIQGLLDKFALYEESASGIELVEDSSPESEIIETDPKPKSKKSKFNNLLLIVNLAAMLFIVLLIKFTPQTNFVYKIATLDEVAGAQWVGSSQLLNKGDNLYSNDHFSLAGGLVEITTENDVNLIIEGPAEFAFTKDCDLKLERGKVYSDVPAKGIGFTVLTGTSRITDLGTVFCVQANGSESTETYVLKGRVALQGGSTSQKKIVVAGQGRSVKTDGTITEIPVSSNYFVDKKEFLANVKASRDGYSRWLAYSYTLRRDPDLIGYYTFEKEKGAPKSVYNKAWGTSGEFDAELNDIPEERRPTWSTGRWKQKDAMHFERAKKQYLRVKGGEQLYQNGPITLAAWIKCPKESDGGHILSNRNEIAGSSNYQFGYKIMQSFGGKVDYPNRMQITRKTTSEDNHQVYSEELEFSAYWLFIAVTHDNHTVSFYENGKLVESQPWELQQEKVEADLWIGSDCTETMDKYFNGIMDEVVILKRDLSPEEIRAMYEAGKP